MLCGDSLFKLCVSKVFINNVHTSPVYIFLSLLDVGEGSLSFSIHYKNYSKDTKSSMWSFRLDGADGSDLMSLLP